MNFTLPEASNFAPQTDYILLALLVLSGGVLALVLFLMLNFAFRYRASSPLDRGKIREQTWRIETAWTSATLFGFFGLFFWGARLFVHEFSPPADALKINVVGKQWMWKFEHPNGQKEINVLHVPVGEPVQLLMTSEDVIHDVAVPAFRVRHDVLPGRYETLWFVAKEAGTYNLFCDQLCGADHSLMRGIVIAMRPADYQHWLATNGSSVGLVAAGAQLFIQLGCAGCHGGHGTVRAPPLEGVYDSPQPLSDGTTVIADEKYLRDSILFPRKQVVASYVPVMPSFNGKITDADLAKLLAYIKSLGAERPPR